MVKSFKKLEKGSKIQVMVTHKGRSENSGEPCLYGIEMSTYSKYKKSGLKDDDSSSNCSEVKRAVVKVWGFGSGFPVLKLI